MKNTIILFVLMIAFAFSCSDGNKHSDNNSSEPMFKTIGKIEKLDSLFDEVFPGDAKIELLADGFIWSEGPVWIEAGNYLLFSDVPANKIYKWHNHEGLSVYLEPSGFTAKVGKGEGSNGLLLNKDGKLVLCQHGDRRIAILNSTFDSPKPNYITLIDNYNGKKFNSPNDAAFNSRGELYFTDPPYGLEGQDNDPLKELAINGVYKTDKSGKALLLDDQLKRPNGIAFSPDEKVLYVANSDHENPILKAYDVNKDGLLENGRVFFDASSLQGEEVKGLPDGMKVNDKGYIFATGPGGVLILTPEGKHIGTVNPGVAVANVAIGGDGYLYLTSHMYLTRVKIL